MTLDEIKAKISSDKYNFLKTDVHLGSNVILLGLGGSHAYGMDTPTSDLDVRGVALNTREEILTYKNFEQFTNEATDTTIYSFNKMIHLLSNCNPNTIEILGLLPEHYLYVSSIGKELLDNKKMFLSKKAAHAFGGYATAQLRRLDNKSARLVGQEQRERHIMNSILSAKDTFPEKYFEHSEDSIKLYIDKSVQEGYDTEIFMDVNLTHYPLRDYKSMWSEMNAIVKDYGKIGKRNSRAIEHNKLGKHMAHLIRLYLMAFDIFEKQEIITYRKDDLELLMDIRNGKYLDDNRQPISEFYEIVDEFEKRLSYDKENTDLPEFPDYKLINGFVADVNDRVVRGLI